MNAVSVETQERSRKNHSMILQRLSSVGQVNIAKTLSISEGTVSKMKSEGAIEQFSLMLAALGLKAVPIEMQCYPREQIGAILTLARANLQRIETPDQLTFED